MTFSSLQSLGLALISLTLVVIIRSYIGRRSLPPGPRGLPLVGNLLDIPKSQPQWLTFLQMSRKYKSDIISLTLGTDTVIVLNSLNAVEALLEKKSSIYSDRYPRRFTFSLMTDISIFYHSPSFPMLNDCVGFDWHFGFMRYGPKWKGIPITILMHRPVELQAARLLLQQFLVSPANFERHFRHMAGMVILSTAYGIDVLQEDDPYIGISEKATRVINCAAIRGSFLVDSLPFLKYVPDFFPGAGFKKQAREWFKIASKIPEVPFDFVRKARAIGTARTSIASQVLDEIEENSSDNQVAQESLLKNILAVCYPGADTTVSALSTFILAMTMYPEVQKKAQAAIDQVICGRLPDFEDNIPYLDAVLRELLRWRPVVPLSIPHAVSEDDVYEGYHIPAGAIVLGNAQAILHDEATYGPHPDQFIPERWLTKDGKINTEMRDPSAAWGFGRRICPGRDMAQWSIWICIASILATFNISKSLDEKGVPIEPSGEYTSGLGSYPVPHQCDILPRSEAARAMISSAA
ncbi:cytochrome P450 [Mycena sanguinolenta]|nr:cytochrome P450 [Mycena sanguinolenta]